MKKSFYILSSVLLTAALFAGVILCIFGVFGTTSASAESVYADEDQAADSVAVTPQSYENGIIETEDLFSKRDLAQTADLSDAVYLKLSDNEDLSIIEAGIYVISGTASEATILVDAPDDAKVQLVLDSVSVTNVDFPCIYVKAADKVFITTSSDSSLTVTGAFLTDGTVKTDAAVFSRSDIVFNGTAVLSIDSGKHGISGKDDIKITGGAYTITAVAHGIEANDSVRIADGSLTVKAGKDAIHCENDDDDTLGYVYICGGTLEITAGDDGIHAVSAVQIDDGDLQISAGEGVESTRVQINGGTISITASDDGINAARKSSSFTPFVEINGGEITISMGAGDTDGVDANGNITINGGTVSVTGMSTFDYDGTGVINGGTVICNGEQVTSLPNQQFGAMGWGAPGGWGGHGGPDGKPDFNGTPPDDLPDDFPGGDFSGNFTDDFPEGFPDSFPSNDPQGQNPGDQL